MARSRNIKPGIMANDELAALDPLTRLLFVYLWMLADREGRLEDRPSRIAAQALPYDRAANVDEMLAQLHAGGFIRRYGANGGKCIQIVAFAKHQNPHVREAASALPAEHVQGDAEAQPGQCSAPGPAQPSPEPARLIPDSLFSDSLISDSKERPSVSSSRPTIPCPYESIVDLYHDKLPDLPRVKLMSPSRQKAMRKWWGWILSSAKPNGERRATTADDALQWIASYFERASANDFLMGKGERTGPHKDWRADFDFLLTEKGMRQVIEKTEAAA